MKTFLTFLFTSFVFVFYAQPPARGQGGGPPQGGQGMQREMPKFDAYKTAGIFNYDIPEVLKKLKIKKDKDLTLQVEQALLNYNSKIDELRLRNQKDFDTLNVYINAIISTEFKNRMENRQQGRQFGGGEASPMRNAIKFSREKIRPVRQQVMQEEKKLNVKLKSILNEKQNIKWLKYQKSIKNKLNPRRQSNNQNPNNQNGRNGRQGRFQQGG
ncbi:hypothetical protein EYD45_01940 [Hyunsoonleella flava]|uniref:Uncharacterized protein n=1 Tax=Hyunsoonleella flava TaxID=2527939 RepID=A0A4Q9FHV2_9FLAO|nr:hypothetical protein [Hyunsoonleella flava]TBN06668.1 hypothetical protein EYD45_01940 [Hyunsoonleella flava]